jgi:CO dehydrogenase nickel-insertion accessory protein CooC1
MIRMADDLGIDVKRKGIILNRVPTPQNGGSGIPPAVQAMLDSYDAPLVGVIPADPLVNQYDAEGLPLAHLPADSAARRAVATLTDRILFS